MMFYVVNNWNIRYVTWYVCHTQGPICRFKIIILQLQKTTQVAMWE